MKQSKTKSNIILYLSIYLVALLAFVIIITVKTNLEAIRQEVVYKLLYSLFMLICVLPFICLLLNALKHISLNADNVVFVCILAIIAFVVAIFIYGDGHTVPGGTENIFQYATTKL